MPGDLTLFSHVWRHLHTHGHFSCKQTYIYITIFGSGRSSTEWMCIVYMRTVIWRTPQTHGAKPFSDLSVCRNYQTQFSLSGCLQTKTAALQSPLPPSRLIKATSLIICNLKSAPYLAEYNKPTSLIQMHKINSLFLGGWWWWWCISITVCALRFQLFRASVVSLLSVVSSFSLCSSQWHIQSSIELSKKQNLQKKMFTNSCVFSVHDWNFLSKSNWRNAWWYGVWELLLHRNDCVPCCQLPSFLGYSSLQFQFR